VSSQTRPTFFYDLASAESYLVAERVLHALPALAEWQPVAMPPRGEELADEDVERRARAYELQALRWPAAWPADSAAAMRAATYAKQIGRGVAFSQAAFRQAFAGGRDLSDPDTIVIAGAACEMHPTALLKGIKLRSVREALEQATGAARSAGVQRVPAVQIGDQVFHGDDGLAAAAGALAA
jgi:2-hydroxychromene-2-carboxylate isomerase